MLYVKLILATSFCGSTTSSPPITEPTEHRLPSNKQQGLRKHRCTPPKVCFSRRHDILRPRLEHVNTAAAEVT